MVVIRGLNCQRLNGVGLILWIDENTFSTALLEKAFKTRSLPIYTLNHAKDFSFLVEDLHPEILVLDCLTAQKNLKELQFQYENSASLRNLPVILIGDDEGLEFIHNRMGQIRRPFDPFKIPEIIQSIKSQ